MALGKPTAYALLPVTDAALSRLSEHNRLSGLHTLDLQRCEKLTSQGSLLQVLSQTSQLRVLNVSGIPSIDAALQQVLPVSCGVICCVSLAHVMCDGRL